MESFKYGARVTSARLQTWVASAIKTIWFVDQAMLRNESEIASNIQPTLRALIPQPLLPQGRSDYLQSPSPHGRGI